ncbi:MAG: hypothetical protein ACP5PA_04605 [Elusimicrobiales bacterium]
MKELSIETKQKLSRLKPSTLAETYRIPGITYTDIQLIWIILEKEKYEKAKRDS